jgi:hypothetical protein
MDLPCQAIILMQLQDTKLTSSHGLRDTKPNDLMRRTHVPINLRMTNPPSIVLISGIPLCFAYGAYATTNKLAAPANTIYQ